MSQEANQLREQAIALIEQGRLLLELANSLDGITTK